MNRTELRDACLALTGAEETFPFGPEYSVFKVRGKMFALSDLEAATLSINLKCDPEQALTLRAGYEGIGPGYHMNKKHWNTVLCEADVPDALLRDMIEDSYDLVVEGLPRRAKEELRWQGLADS